VPENRCWLNVAATLRASWSQRVLLFVVLMENRCHDGRQQWELFFLPEMGRIPAERYRHLLEEITEPVSRLESQHLPAICVGPKEGRCSIGQHDPLDHDAWW
jgi:hypothetical protein